MNTDTPAGLPSPPAPSLSNLIDTASAIENEIAILQARLALVRLEIERSRAGTEAIVAVVEADPAPESCWTPLISQRLTLIRGIDAEAATMLNGLGVTAFADIAALTPEDVQELERMLGAKRRISAQCWIEQAAMLARGDITSFAARVMRGEMDAVATPPVMAETAPFAAADAADTLAVATATAAAQQQAAVVEAPVLAPVAAIPSGASEAAVKPLDNPSNVTALETARSKRKASASRGAVSAGRWAALTASVLIVLGIAFGSTNIGALVMDQVGLFGCTVQGVASVTCAHLAHAAF